MNNNRISEKLRHLEALIRGYGTLAVAFSGGVDSTFLLAVARKVLGRGVHAIVARSSVFSAYEASEALNYVRQQGIPHHEVSPDLMSVAEFVQNRGDRCYHCKLALFAVILEKKDELGLNVLAHGVNGDDLNDFRPGLRAADELGVVSPLAVAGFTKDEIRRASRDMGLGTADKPQMACLATRIPYGTPVSLEKLRMVEQGEELLRNLGCGSWRVRHHGDLARIEVHEEDFQKLMKRDVRGELVARFKALGFLHVALDLEGYTPGSMNRVLMNREKESGLAGRANPHAESLKNS